MSKIICYNKKEKKQMITLYEAYKNYSTVSKIFGCAISTIYYAVNPDKYELHKEHVYNMRHK